MKSKDIEIGKRYHVRSDRHGDGIATVLETGVEYSTSRNLGGRGQRHVTVTAKGGIRVKYEATRFDGERVAIVRGSAVLRPVDEDAAARRARNVAAIDDVKRIAAKRGITLSALRDANGDEWGSIAIGAGDLLALLRSAGE